MPRITMVWFGKGRVPPGPGAGRVGSGRSERLIGEALRHVRRDAIFLASKVGWDWGPHDHPYHPEWIRSQVERSLSQLRTDYIDLYYLHHCDFGPEDRYLDDAIGALERLRDEGKIGHIGLSDWKMSAIMRVIARVEPDVVQPYRNLLDDDYASSGLKAWVEAHDVGVAFFSPLRHGLLLGKYDEPTTFPEGDFRSNDPAFQNAALLDDLRRAADALRERFGGTCAAPVLHGVLGPLTEDAPGGCVLLGQRNPSQVEAAAAVGGAMSAADAAWVRSLYADLSTEG